MFGRTIAGVQTRDVTRTQGFKMQINLKSFYKVIKTNDESMVLGHSCLVVDPELKHWGSTLCAVLSN